jgi:hypothetical protein
VKSLRILRRHAYIVPSIFLTTVIFIWFVTYGSWNLFEAENFGDYYDAQAYSMLSGHLDVPAEAIGPEAFIKDGNYYGYFGIAPSLLRIPLNAVFPSMYGRWSRTFLLVGYVLNLVLAYRILVLAGSGFASARSGVIQKFIYTLFLLAVGLGSTNIFLSSRAFIYHEAIMLAGMFGLGTCYYAIRYFIDRKSTNLILACCCAFMSFFSKVTIGTGAVLLMAMLFALLLAPFLAQLSYCGRIEAMVTQLQEYFAVPKLIRAKHIIIIGVFGAILFSSYVTVNYLKFGTFLDGSPLKWYGQYMSAPERLERSGGKQLSLRNLRTTSYNYFVATNIDIEKSFPWLYMQHPAPQSIFPEQKIDVFEQVASIPASTPFLFLLSLVGICVLIAGRSQRIVQFRLPAIGALVGGSLILMAIGITYRYIHDYFPFLVLTGALGVQVVLLINKNKYVYGILLILSLLALFSIYTNLAFAIVYQRELVWGVNPDKTTAFRSLRSSIDSIFQFRPLAVIYTTTLEAPANPLRGQVWVVDNTEATFWYDGQQWVTLERGSAQGLIKLHIAFPETPARELEPIVTTGKTHVGDFVYVRYLPEGKIAFGLDHWGYGGEQGDPIAIKPGRFYDVVVDLDRVNHQVVVLLDGREVFLQRSELYPTTPEQISLGANNIGGRIKGFDVSYFSGVIAPARERANAPAHLQLKAATAGAEMAFDNDARTEWSAKGGGSATLSLTPSEPRSIQTLTFVSRLTNLLECWKQINIKLYRNNMLVSEQTVTLQNATVQRVQTIAIQPIQVDRIELSFSDPVTTTLTGGTVDPAAVNPGYTEIFIGWQ